MLGHFHIPVHTFIDLVPSLFQDALDHIVIVRTIFRGTFARILKTFPSVLFGKVEYAQTGFVGLFGVLLLLQDGNDVPFTVSADIARPIDEPLKALCIP